MCYDTRVLTDVTQMVGQFPVGVTDLGFDTTDVPSLRGDPGRHTREVDALAAALTS